MKFIDVLVDNLAVQTVIETERRLGFDPSAVEAEKLGYDVESRDPETGRLRFIEVKGLAPDRREVHVTRNEILTGLNKPEDFILALVRVDGHEPAEPRYLRGPLDVQIGFTVTGVDFHVAQLLDLAERPG